MTSSTKGTTRASKQKPTATAPVATADPQAEQALSTTQEVRIDVANSKGEFVSTNGEVDASRVLASTFGTSVDLVMPGAYVLREAGYKHKAEPHRAAVRVTGHPNMRYPLRKGEATKIPIDAKYKAADGIVPIFIPTFHGLSVSAVLPDSGEVYVTPLSAGAKWLQTDMILGHLYFVDAINIAESIATK